MAVATPNAIPCDCRNPRVEPRGLEELGLKGRKAGQPWARSMPSSSTTPFDGKLDEQRNDHQSQNEENNSTITVKPTVEKRRIDLYPQHGQREDLDCVLGNCDGD